MRLLVLVPNSSPALWLRHVARWNPDLTWDALIVRDEAVGELYDWCETVRVLGVRDRWLGLDPPDTEAVPDLPHLQYERACCGLDLTLVGQFWHHAHLPDMADMLRGMLERWFPGEYDAVVLWNETGWHNETAKLWAQERGLPVIFVERASFPGMLVVDGTGLREECCDLERYGETRVAPEIMRAWLSVGTRQSIETQRVTTSGEVHRLLGGVKTTLVPLQVPYDTNMVFRAGVVNTNDALLEWAAANHVTEQVVVKRHPVDIFTDQERLEAKCEELGFLLTDYAVQSLLEQVDRVLTINSQVGVEAWMHEVPVTFLGRPAFRMNKHPQRNLEVLRFGYYVEPVGFGARVREIIERKNGEST